MSKTLIIVRHGNTFVPGQIPTRIGGKTDLPLVEEQRGRSVGKYLIAHNLTPDKVYAAPLQRTMQTAALIIAQMNLALEVIPAAQFTEIDYGVDENKIEEQVQYRLGREFAAREGLLATATPEAILQYGAHIIDLWNTQAVVPSGWQVDVATLIQAWHDFAANIQDGETTLLCTSNGIIRFAPHLLQQEYAEFCQQHDLKVATGSVSIFQYTSPDQGWVCLEWNTKAINNHKALDISPATYPT